MPDVAPETQELAPRVVVEPARPEKSGSINLIESPQVAQELKLEPPKPGESATSLAPETPATAPSEPKKPINLISDKLANVIAPQVKNSSYPGGLDPYREPIE
jgi:hypothetical protein